MSVGMNVSFLVVTTGEFLLGMLGNGFIGVVYCIEWVKNGKISLADFILTNLAMARIIQLWLILMDAFIMVLSPNRYGAGNLAKVISVLWTLSNHLTTWLATCLSVFYFLRIATFSHFFFIWLKWRVNKVIIVIFLGSFFFLSVNLFTQDVISELWISTYRIHERNTTLPSGENKTLYLYTLPFLSLVYIIPFFLSLTALLLLFLSLVRHTKNFQSSQMGLRDSSTETHKRALKTVATFVLLFIIYFMASQTACWIFLKIERYQVIMLIIMLSAVFPTGHSFIIIFGNSKLRQIALRLLWCLKLSGRETEHLAL